ncbi:MAG: hypothetical protein IPJ34_13160 [Myxococcales bacterium]|nr:hypothetical protein [Myxococcales bacterium]
MRSMVGTPDAPELRAVFENARAQLYAGQTPIAEALLRGLLSKVEEQPAPAVVIAEAKELLADFLFVGHGRAEEGLALVLSASRYRREQFTTEPLPLIRNMLLAVRYELALAAFSAAVKLAEVARNHAERLLGAHELTVRANLLLAVALRDRARNMIGMTDRDADLNVAFRAAQRACELAQRLHGASSLEVAQAYETFAQILADLDRVERAKLSLGIALRIYERLYADAGLARSDLPPTSALVPSGAGSIGRMPCAGSERSSCSIVGSRDFGEASRRDIYSRSPLRSSLSGP